ncbi:MAG: hypothetical protein B0D92_08635 [Spirochaeta sp. LUC14_002_19_P3]|nr:MAG: hypothetical protein B0D92_08635 [Spirochaeta sp. LUC14_002_19_P3]
MKWNAVIISFAAIVCLAAAGCAKNGKTDMDPAKVLNWNLSSSGPQTLDPGLNGASDGGDVGNQIFEGLVREQNGKVVPGIAESWTFSNDDKTITFHLRDSRWSDGSKLTAHDFIYSWKRAMDPATASEYSWIWEYTNVVGAQKAAEGNGSLDAVGIKALDDYTLEVNLNYPTAYFVSLMAFYHFHPVKESAVKAGPDGTWASNPELFVGNGPFMVSRYTIGEGMTVVKNPNYWNAENVKLDAINIAFIDDHSTAYQAYKNGELDFINEVPPAEVPRLIAEDPEFYVFPLLGTYYYNFNLDLDIWKDVKVRRALTLAIDRNKIVEVLAKGNISASGFVPPGFPDHQGKDFAETAGNYGIPADSSKVEEAKSLLAEAGYPNGEGFPKFILLYNTSEGHQLVAEMVQEMWKINLGIVCDLENQEWAVFQDTRKEGDYDMARGGWLTDFLDPMGLLAIFQSNNAYNDPNYYNDKYDALISAANISIGANHFDQLYAAQEILMADLPVIPVYHYTDDYLSSPQVKNWKRSMLGTVDFSVAYMER